MRCSRATQNKCGTARECGCCIGPRSCHATAPAGRQPKRTHSTLPKACAQPEAGRTKQILRGETRLAGRRVITKVHRTGYFRKLTTLSAHATLLQWAHSAR